MATRHTYHRHSSADSAVGRTPRRRAPAWITAATAALLAVSFAPSVADATPPLPRIACDPVATGAPYLDIPVDHLRAELAEDALAADGTTVEMLLERVDAIAEVRLAHAGRTDGPQQAAALRLIRTRHDELRFLILGGTCEAGPKPL
jgi:hypothetical protein